MRRTHLFEEMVKKGITVLLHSDVVRLDKLNDASLSVALTGSQTTPLEVDKVLYVTGRVPNTPGLGLAELGVAVDEVGGVKVDAFGQTNIKSIHAVGDVTNRIALTPVAIREGAALANTLFGPTPVSADLTTVPSAVFSQPPIGTVGLTEAQALVQYGEIDIYSSKFRNMRHTSSGRNERTLVKLIVDSASQRVLGAHMVSTDSPEIIQGLAVAIRMGATKADFDATVGLHPSAAEEFVTLHDKVTRKKMTERLAFEHQELVKGLYQTPASISPKYFYDTKGSELFEDITRLQEYYPTRTERAIMSDHAQEIARAVGPQRIVIEPGAGNCQKAKYLCELIDPARFVAVDISEAFLLEAVAGMRLALPHMVIDAIASDLTADIVLPLSLPVQGRLVFYPGSSIGNFDPPLAQALLSRMRGLLQDDGALLIGVDLVKDESVLNAAYDDEAGVTAAFNLNVLRNVNRLIGSDFDPNQWQHRAFFNAEQSRIEMHLQAKTDLLMQWRNGARSFSKGECIHTENSYKYRVKDFQALLRRSGFSQTQVWTDEQDWYALVLARP